MKKKLFSIAQVILAFVIIGYLFMSIHKSTVRVDLVTPPTTVGAEAVYTLTSETETNRFYVINATHNATEVSLYTKESKTLSLPEGGSLTREDGTGPDSLTWSRATLSRYGLVMIRSALGDATQRWPLLLVGLMVFAACLTVVIMRWKALLNAQGLELPWGRVTVLYMVGHFFNLFLVGSTGGDLVKAYMVSRETPDKKTAAVSTIIIDRIIGLLALVALVLVMMLLQLPFFLKYNETRIAMIFNIALFLGATFGLFLVFRQNMFERSPLFRRIEEKTRLGPMLAKMYTAFHTCFTSPALVLKTLSLSVANHIILIFSMYCLGIALGLELPFISYLAVGPIINAVGAIPVTPGGLGTRDAAAVFLLGALGVAEARALMLTLLVYLAMTFWSLVGGVIYFFYIYQRGERIPDDIEAE